MMPTLVPIKAKCFDCKVYVPAEYAMLSSIVASMRTLAGWEPDETTAWKRIFKAFGTGTFLDVGANVGYYSILAAKLGNAVLAIEPVHELVSAIEATASLNDLPIIVFEAAAWSKSNDKIEIFVTLEDQISGGGMSFMKRPNSIRKIEALTIALDDLQAETKFVKVDVEGAEKWVLDGAKRMLEQKLIWMFEFNPAIHLELNYDYLNYLHDFKLFSTDLKPIDPDYIYDFATRERKANSNRCLNFFASKTDLSVIA